MRKQAIWLIIAAIFALKTPLEYYVSPKLQPNVNWSQSVHSSSDHNVQEFNAPIYKSVYSVMDFLEKRNLDIRSQNGRFILFYKVK